MHGPIHIFVLRNPGLNARELAACSKQTGEPMTFGYVRDALYNAQEQGLVRQEHGRWYSNTTPTNVDQPQNTTE